MDSSRPTRAARTSLNYSRCCFVSCPLPTTAAVAAAVVGDDDGAADPPCAVADAAGRSAAVAGRAADGEEDGATDRDGEVEFCRPPCPLGTRFLVLWPEEERRPPRTHSSETPPSDGDGGADDDHRSHGAEGDDAGADDDDASVDGDVGRDLRDHHDEDRLRDPGRRHLRDLCRDADEDDAACARPSPVALAL